MDDIYQGELFVFMQHLAGISQLLLTIAWHWWFGSVTHIIMRLPAGRPQSPENNNIILVKIN